MSVERDCHPFPSHLDVADLISKTFQKKSTNTQFKSSTNECDNQKLNFSNENYDNEVNIKSSVKLAEFNSNLSSTLVNRRKNLLEARWLPKRRLAKIIITDKNYAFPPKDKMHKSKTVSKAISSLQTVRFRSKNGNLISFLRPEEALYLLESNGLILYDLRKHSTSDGVVKSFQWLPLSMEEAYLRLIDSLHSCNTSDDEKLTKRYSLSLIEYQTYCHLRRLGFKVIRSSVVKRYQHHVKHVESSTNGMRLIEKKNVVPASSCFSENEIITISDDDDDGKIDDLSSSGPSSGDSESEEPLDDHEELEENITKSLALSIESSSESNDSKTCSIEQHDNSKVNHTVDTEQEIKSLTLSIEPSDPTSNENVISDKELEDITKSSAMSTKSSSAESNDSKRCIIAQNGNSNVIGNTVGDSGCGEDVDDGVVNKNTHTTKHVEHNGTKNENVDSSNDPEVIKDTESVMNKHSIDISMNLDGNVTEDETETDVPLAQAFEQIVEEVVQEVKTSEGISDKMKEASENHHTLSVSKVEGNVGRDENAVAAEADSSDSNDVNEDNHENEIVESESEESGVINENNVDARNDAESSNPTCETDRSVVTTPSISDSEEIECIDLSSDEEGGECPERQRSHERQQVKTPTPLSSISRHIQIVQDQGCRYDPVDSCHTTTVLDGTSGAAEIIGPPSSDESSVKDSSSDSDDIQIIEDTPRKDDKKVEKSSNFEKEEGSNRFSVKSLNLMPNLMVSRTRNDDDQNFSKSKSVVLQTPSAQLLPRNTWPCRTFYTFDGVASMPQSSNIKSLSENEDENLLETPSKSIEKKRRKRACFEHYQRNSSSAFQSRSNDSDSTDSDQSYCIRRGHKRLLTMNNNNNNKQKDESKDKIVPTKDDVFVQYEKIKDTQFIFCDPRSAYMESFSQCSVRYEQQHALSPSTSIFSYARSRPMASTEEDINLISSLPTKLSENFTSEVREGKVEEITKEEEEEDNELIDVTSALTRGPLTTLWSVGESRPRMRPSNATKICDIFNVISFPSPVKSLVNENENEIICISLSDDEEEKEDTKDVHSKSDSVSQSFHISFDVFLPGTKKSDMKSVLPTCQIVVLDHLNDFPPEYSVIHEHLVSSTEKEIPILFAHITNSGVNFYSLDNNFVLPSIDSALVG